MQDVIDFLIDNPELLKINSQYQCNEGYLKSLKEDKEVKKVNKSGLSNWYIIME